MAARLATTALAITFTTPTRAVKAQWYDGLDSVQVFGPAEDVGAYANKLWQTSATAQFGLQRHAILLTRGDHGTSAQIPVGYYTGVYGTGRNASDVHIASFYTLDNPEIGNACDNFWRSVEGVTTTNPSIMWAASQAAPLRRLHVTSELRLSMHGPSHWSSGGYMADSIVDGPLVMGTQQQYFVRNSRLKQGVEGTSMNYVFVGTEGAPESSPTGQVTTEDSTPAVAAKPYLIEEDGVWSILVPKVVKGSVGPLSSSQEDTVVPMSQVYVARPGDTARTINTGIQGMRALLITPAVYDLNGTVVITESNFVVLGLGFATLVSRNGHSALQVSENAAGVRVAGVLFESGSALKADAISSPLVEWAGADGVASDLFTRAGSFSNSPSRCLQVRQDVHARIGGDGVVVDNTWMWHADHDDCGGASDGAFSGNGLVVQGRNVVAYGLKVEHMMRNLVEWYGENGETYLYQSELPYHAPTFNGVGYYVHPSVRSHKALAIGVYIVGDLIAQTGIRVPPTANLKNAFAWVITGAHSQFHSVVCTNTSTCYFGQRCTYNACYQYELPQVLKGGGVGSLPRPALSEDRSGYSTGGEGYLPEFA